MCISYIDLVGEHGFTQTVNFATKGNNILNVFLTNRPPLIVIIQSSISSAPQQHNPTSGTSHLLALIFSLDTYFNLGVAHVYLMHKQSFQT